MDVYIFLWVLICVCIAYEELFGCKKIKIKQLKIHFDFRVFIYAIFVLFFSLRYEIGFDYARYYEYIENGWSGGYLFRGELLSYLIMEISSFAKMPQLFFIVNAIISLSLLFVTLKRVSVGFSWAVLWFLSYTFFFIQYLSIVRFFTAISIMFYAMKYIKEGRMNRYILMTFIASMFHITALFGLIFYLMHKIELNRRNMLFFMILIILFIRYSSIILVELFPLYEWYFTDAAASSGKYAIYPLLLVLIFVFICYHKLKSNEYFKISFISFCVGVSMYISLYSYGTISYRISAYGYIYSILLIPMILNAGGSEFRFYIKTLFFIFCSIMYFWTLYISWEWYIPYKTFLSCLN